jgi:hypothetical protein
MYPNTPEHLDANSAQLGRVRSRAQVTSVVSVGGGLGERARLLYRAAVLQPRQSAQVAEVPEPRTQGLKIKRSDRYRPVRNSVGYLDVSPVVVECRVLPVSGGRIGWFDGSRTEVSA